MMSLNSNTLQTHYKLMFGPDIVDYVNFAFDTLPPPLTIIAISSIDFILGISDSFINNFFN